MLRSEVEWFPRFLQICVSYLHCIRWREDHHDYPPMQCVLKCQSKREVQSFLNTYRDTDFRKMIQLRMVEAQKITAIEKRNKK